MINIKVNVMLSDQITTRVMLSNYFEFKRSHIAVPVMLTENRFQAF